MAAKSFMEKEYKLKNRPFREIVAARALLNSWVDREEQMKEWGSLINRAVSGKSHTLSFIIGDYGTGKTMSLLKIAEDTKKTHKEVLPVYMSFHGEQKTKNPGIDFIQKIFKSIDFDKLNIKKRKDILPDSLSSEVKNVYKKIFYGEEDTKNLAIYFLEGDLKPNQTQLKKLGIIRKINDIDIAKEYLIGLLYILKSAGLFTLLLAIDEFEYLFSLVSKANQAIYLSILRRLYDLTIEEPKDAEIANMIIFLAVSEDGWRRMQELEKRDTSIAGPIQPLMRRVQGKITLKPFSKGDTERLIEKRLSINRITGEIERDPLIPFTKDFVEYVFKLSVGKPSDIILRCDHVLDAGLESMTPKLTADFAKQVFERRGLAY